MSTRTKKQASKQPGPFTVAQPGPDLLSFNVTVLGRFNPHIVEPGWAARHGIVPEGELQVFMHAGGQAPLYQMPSGLGWTVQADRLIIFGNRTEAPDFLDRLLEALPHTPITAVGVNFKIAAKNDSKPSSHGRSLEATGLADPIESSESRVHQLPKGVKMTIKVTWGQREKVMDVNYHVDASERASMTEHLRRVPEFEKQIRELLAKI